MASDRRKTIPVSVAFSRRRVSERWLPPMEQLSPDLAAGRNLPPFPKRKKNQGNKRRI